MTRDALVVGINQYPFLRENPASRTKNLTTPASDAEAIAQLLENYGDFQVRRLPETNQDGKLRVDPKKSVKLKELQDAIAELFHPKNGQVPETAVLFFAGHGLRRSLAGGTEGYLVTSDSPKQENWGLSLRWLRQLLHESPVRQQVIWLDCCHSGELLNFAETDLGEYEKGRDRCFIVASRDFQVAYAAALGEHGVLSGALIQGLDPTLQPDKWVTNFTLVDFVKQALKEAPQHPICTNSGGQIILTGEQGVLANICPYKGLAYFDFNPEDPLNAEDPKYFFGRTNLTKQLLEKVRESNFLAVLGASGSGKSSVVRAGLLYQLYLGEAIPGSDTADATLRERWKIYPPFTPGSQPLVRLKEVIGVEAEQLEPLLNAAASDRVVLVIDQFEEVFTECRDKNERQKFFKYLMRAIARLGKKLCLVLVMRSDFQGQCDDYPELAAKIDENLVRVMQMNQEELREAITKPAEKVGLVIERELITQMIADVEGSPGDLPLLQYALTELWEQRKLNRLTISDYTRLGGVKKALEKHANQVYEDLSTEEKQVAKRIFFELTRLGEGTEDTRRQVRQQDLVNSKQSQAIVDQVVQHLAKKKLIVTGEQEWEDERVAIVNIAHEALIRNWNLLAKWLKENQVALLKKQEIEDAAQTWRDNRKRGEKAYLLQGTRLATAEDYLQRYTDNLPLSGLAQEFVRKSIKHRQSSRRNLFITVTTIILGLSGLTAWALIEGENAQIRALSASSEALFGANREFDALIESMRAAKRLQRAIGIRADTRMQVLTTLRKAVYGVTERNRLEDHKAAVSVVKFSPDGQRIASASSDNTIKLWSLDGTLLKTLQGHNNAVIDVSFSPDGQIIASVSRDNTIKLWRLDGTLFKTLHRQAKNISFSPDSQVIALSGNDNSVEFCSRDGTLIKTLKDAGGAYVSFSPDGALIAAASELTTVNNTIQYTLKIWTREGSLFKTIPLSGSGDLLSNSKQIINSKIVSFSPDGEIIATAGYDKTIQIWSRDGTLLKTINQHKNVVNSVAFSPDSQMIASADFNGIVYLWSRKGTLIKTFTGHNSSVNSVNFSPDGQIVASASDDSTIKLWSLNNIPLKTLKGHTQLVKSVSFSPNSKTIVSTSDDFTIKLWSNDGTLIKTIDRDSRWNDVVRFSPDGKMIAFDERDTIEIRSNNGTFIKSLNGHNNKVYGISFSTDSKKIASVSADKTVKLWKTDGTLLQTFIGHNSDVYGVSISPDSKMIASGSADNTVKLWKIDGTLLQTFIGHTNDVWSVSFSRDGKTIASGSADGTIKLWRLDGSLLQTFRGHNGLVKEVSFSPDGWMIISAAWDSTVKLWRTDGTLLTTLQGSSGVYSANMSSDSKTIVSSSDEDLILWNLDLDDLLIRGCNWGHDYINTNPNGQKYLYLCPPKQREQ